MKTLKFIAFFFSSIIMGIRNSRQGARLKKELIKEFGDIPPATFIFKDAQVIVNSKLLRVCTGMSAPVIVGTGRIVNGKKYVILDSALLSMPKGYLLYYSAHEYAHLTLHSEAVVTESIYDPLSFKDLMWFKNHPNCEIEADDYAISQMPEGFTYDYVIEARTYFDKIPMSKFDRWYYGHFFEFVFPQHIQSDKIHSEE